MKYDVNCYDYMHQNDGPWTAVYNNVQALVTFSWHTMSALIGEESFICSRTVKLNKQSKTLACMLEMGYHWRSTHKYTFIDAQ